MEVWGTEISVLGRQFRFTVAPWDFHDVKPHWEGRVDFVYSNALDHSFDPPLALRAWMKSVAPDGALLLEHSFAGGAAGDPGVLSDPYQASMAQLQRLVLLSGAFELCDVLRRGGSLWLVVS